MNQEEWKEREKIYACWLCNFPCIGSRKVHQLSEACGGPEGAYYAGKAQWGQVLTPNQVEALNEYTEKWHPEEEYHKMQEEGIELVTIHDPDYPERLKNIPDPPFGIFVRGKLPADDIPAVAVIGARECSEYGRYVARELGTALGRHGVVVVSGMAKGIDGISQEGALEGGGVSIGVLGSGVDVCYPAQNRGIYEQLLKSGAVLSTYPNGTPARPQNFPPRNRIVSGLADAVVVIEARVRSGTLITVDMALEQGREVYVVPGRVTDRLSDGCNRLIKQGAGVLLSPENFYEELLQLRESKKENKIRHRRHWGEAADAVCADGTAEGTCVDAATVADGNRMARESTGKRKAMFSASSGISISGTSMEAAYRKKIDEAAQGLPEELATVYRIIDFYPRTPAEIQSLLPEAYQGIQMIPCLMQLCMKELAIQVSPGHFCRNGEPPCS